MRERVLWLLACAAAGVLVVAALWQRSGDTSAEPIATPQTRPPLQQSIRVEVLNGCGAAQVASRLTRKARSLGLDVIHEGNAESFAFLHSMVIDRSGDVEKARAVAAVLGIPYCIQQVPENAFRLADVSIVIGRDYRRLNLLANDE